jgi:hypothetical protein
LRLVPGGRPGGGTYVLRNAVSYPHAGSVRRPVGVGGRRSQKTQGYSAAGVQLSAYGLRGEQALAAMG